MIDVTTLSSEELAAAANELIRRAIATVAPAEMTCSAMLHAYVSSYAFDKYEISHIISIGHGGTELKVESGNILEGAERLIAMHNLREGITPVVKVTPQLAAPVVDTLSRSDGIADADWTEVPAEEALVPSPQARPDLNDDVPF